MPLHQYLIVSGKSNGIFMKQISSLLVVLMLLSPLAIAIAIASEHAPAVGSAFSKGPARCESAFVSYGAMQTPVEAPDKDWPAANQAVRRDGTPQPVTPAADMRHAPSLLNTPSKERLPWSAPS